MRYLPLSLLLCFLAACGSSAYRHLQPASADNQCPEKFRPQIDSTILYDAHIDVVGKQLSGLLILKRMPDSSLRIVFTAPAGNSFFDFGFKGNNFTVYSIIPQLDKKAVVKTLQKDFRLTWMIGIPSTGFSVTQTGSEKLYTYAEGKDHYYFITDLSCTNLLRLERGSARRRILTVTRDAHAAKEKIMIKHENFNFDISLERIERNAD